MISRELLRKLRRIEIVTGRIANAQLAGAYQSVFKGIGVAFSEVRQYNPGDDIRRIDWNVTARMGDAYVKLFVEEREMTVMLLVDASASGWFGTQTQSKREVAAEVAALLAFSAIKNNDRVGLIIFTDRVERFVPPKKGKKHVLRVVTEILTFPAARRAVEGGSPTVEASRGTDLRAGLDFLGRVTKRRAVAFLVSDFLAGGYEQALKVALRRHDLIPVTLTDPFEELLPSLGFVTFEDLESGKLLLFDTSGRAARRYAEQVKRTRSERDQLFRRLRLDTIDVRTDAAYVGALLDFFRARERRLGR